MKIFSYFPQFFGLDKILYKMFSQIHIEKMSGLWKLAQGLNEIIFSVYCENVWLLKVFCYSLIIDLL